MPRNEADLVTRDPPNAETPWDALALPRTPPGRFYTRNNFPVPRIGRKEWTMRVGERRIAFDDLMHLPTKVIDVVMECAGNGRTRFDPPAEGTRWRDRAVGCARFRGVPFREVVAGHPPEGTVEVVFRGADHGTAAGRAMSFERSLPLDVAMRDDTLLAFEMEGEPLLPEHGAPVRLLVPRWYGVASVKWLADARFSREPFAGHFQKERYVYERAPGDRDAAPVREMRVKSLIVEPLHARVGEATLVRGWAWSGRAPIEGVEVSLDGGLTWEDADLAPPGEATAWRGFAMEWTPTRAGRAVLLSRATDATGAAQPGRAEWNVHGYGWNAPVPREVEVVG